MRKVTKEYNSEIDKLKQLNVEIENRNIKQKINKNIFDNLRLNNPENPAEIVSKMNDAAPYYWWLGSAMTEIEDKLNALEDEFNFWLETKKHKYDGDKFYVSEGSKERQVIITFPKTYNKFKEDIRNVRYIERKLDVARKAYDKAINLLQSMGRISVDDKDIPDPDVYDIRKRKKINSIS